MKIITGILIFLCGVQLNAQQSPEIILQQGDDHAAYNQLTPAVQIDTLLVIQQIHHNALLFNSLFTRKTEVAEEHPFASPHIHQRNIVLPIFLLLMLTYLTWLRYVFARELNENITVILNSNLGHQIYRDREFSANIFKLLTFLNFTCIAGVFMYLLAMYYHVPMPFKNTGYNIAVLIGGVLILYIVKGFVYDLLSITFRIGNTLSFFRFNALVIYHLLGIALLPLVILASFAKEPVSTWSLFAALALIGLALIVRIIKGFTVAGMMERFHFLYFLLYICALEIAPVLIAVRLFNMWG